MSFEEQERVLFNLIFDPDERARFCADRDAVLADYRLDPEERADFFTVRTDALELDARIRMDLVLSQFCRAYPLTFSLVSSRKGGLDALPGLVDATVMRTPLDSRTAAFGANLSHWLADHPLENPGEQSAMMAIAGAELGMAWTGAELRRHLRENPAPSGDALSLPPDWDTRPLRIAPFVCAALLPQSYSAIKQALCPDADAGLWLRLGRHPLDPDRRRRTLDRQDPRLLLARAFVSRPSPCDNSIDHRTAELSEGFAPLVQQINGSLSAADLVSMLKGAGAPDTMLQSVRAAFRNLLETRMLDCGGSDPGPSAHALP